MENIDLLIHAKYIITCEEHNRVLHDHALVIKDGKILIILPSKDISELYVANEEQHFDHHIIMPGLINAHTHLAMNLFRGLADDLDLMDWLGNHIWPAEGQWVSKELVYDGSLLAMAEMIRGGTTCFNDMYFYMSDAAAAAKQAGMRGHIGMTVMDVPTGWAKNADEYIAKGMDFLSEYKDHALITPTLAPHSTYTMSMENLSRVKKLADDNRLRINIHLQEAPSEMREWQKNNPSKSPIECLDEIGFLSPDVIAIHMTQLSDRDFEILQRTKPSIVHCPESNLKLVSGFCQVEKLLKLHLNVALGTDGAASNNDLDMFGEMRSAAFLGKIACNDPKALSADTAIKMATINGAKALGIDHLVGSLVAGKMADFIAIDIDQIETQPLYQPISQVVYAVPRHQVTDVFVAGKQLLKNRKLTTIDETEVVKKAKFWQEKIKPKVR